MVKKEVKTFGNKGMHITLSKKDGLNIGDEVEVIIRDKRIVDKFLNEDEIEDLIETKIREMIR